MSDEAQTHPTLPHSAIESTPSTGNTVPSELDAEAAEAMRQTFEEMGLSGSRIAKSLERLNSLAQEIYCELDATTKALSLRG